ncbi:MAG: hypothetical protein NVS9B5_35000 [Terriglobales bacterium]
MLPERPRARRYSFPANIELINVGSETKIKAQTCDLNLYGCQVKTGDPWAVGTKVRLKITYKSAAFVAVARVAHMRPGEGMGLRFTDVGVKDKLILERWIAELREQAGERQAVQTL